MPRGNAHAKAAAVTVALVESKRGLTAKEAAQLAGLSWEGGRYLLEMLSLVLPIFESEDDDATRWRLLRDEDFE